MKFVNKGNPIKIRIGNSNDCYWKTLKKGDIIELSSIVGKRLGLTEIKSNKPKLTEGQIGNKKVETKQIENEFLNELCAINGIGKKTAKDLKLVFGTKDALIDAIKSGKDIPIRDDIEILLRGKYGKR